LEKVDWRSSYLLLNPDSALKKLENPFLYHMKTDELYELDEKSIAFLSQCDGTKKGSDLTDDATFIEYCLEEELLFARDQPVKVDVVIGESPLPSLRYLELQLTWRCNLKCRHCYLGPQKKKDLPLQDAINISREFESMGGLRLLISGGEPLLYPSLRQYLEKISSMKIRRVLLTNGTKITSENIKWLNVDEIQFSLDGWKDGHEILRGKGSFDKVVQAIKTTKDSGIQVSIATMVHQKNLNDFNQMKSFISEIDAFEWGIDALCLSGNLNQNESLNVLPQQAADKMQYAFGGGYHGSSDGFACGRHLMTVLPSGMGVKCGFYEESTLGDARKSLKNCWLNLDHLSLDKLTCKDCEMIHDCAGGCRFRAPHSLSPDPYMCALYGIDPLKFS
jgi:radical SAM protein with 4Fe4S-binding SPASM domain